MRRAEEYVRIAKRHRKVAAGQREQTEAKRKHKEASTNHHPADADQPGQPAAEGTERLRAMTEIDGCGKHAHSPLTLRRRANAISTGAPMKAVTMPTCNSPGRSTSRPTMSAASSKIGANTAV